MKIEMKGINKSFGSNQVLKDAGFLLKDGEVHALMGENGAGKSTLMKILTGVYTRDAGTVLVDGQEVVYKSPQEAEKAGIVFIYQELNVLFDLTVEENLFMGKEITKGFGICDKKAMRKKAQEVMDKMGVNIPINAVMSDLSVGQQQMVEICKALMVDAKVLIMDEPTAALTQSETEGLFKLIKSLREKGVSIVYISHRMEEIFELCDRITILRDGTYVGTENIKDITMDDIVRMMIGREIGERYPKRDGVKIGDEILSVENLCKGKVFQNVNFRVHAGEVLGVSGLMGAGRTEIMHAIFGNLPYDSGKILINGKEVQIKSARDAINAGIGFITEDRKTEGLLLEKSIAENIELANLGKVSDRSVLSKKKGAELVKKGIDEFRIKYFGPHHECANLSGGNQQKVVIAKWAYTDPKVLILDEPTRGVDIGAKKEIYSVINDLAAKGAAIIMVSSELPEVLAMILTDGKPISNIAKTIEAEGGSSFPFKLIGKGNFCNVPIPAILLIFALIVFFFVLNKTTFGRKIYATGSNAKCAKLVGVNISLTKIIVYAISGFMAALTGLILISRLDSAQPTLGDGYELDLRGRTFSKIMEELTMKVLTIGSMNIDHVYSVDHIVQPGETLTTASMNIFLGGKGINQSMALAKAGAEVYHSGMIGNDGTLFLEACKEYGVNSDYIREINEKTGHTIIQVDKNAQNCILLYGGANQCLTEEFVDEVLSNFEKDDILLLQNEVNLLPYIIDRAYEKGMQIALNPSPFDDKLNVCDLSKISIFLLNEIEGGQITGETEPDAILDKLQELYPDARIVLTLGKDGAVYAHKDERYQQPIFPVKAVDTTAAGDTFTGYFLAGLIDGMAVPDILRMSAKASSIAVTRAGAVQSIPYRREVDEALKNI